MKHLILLFVCCAALVSTGCNRGRGHSAEVSDSVVQIVGDSVSCAMDITVDSIITAADSIDIPVEIPDSIEIVTWRNGIKGKYVIAFEGDTSARATVIRAVKTDSIIVALPFEMALDSIYKYYCRVSGKNDGIYRGESLLAGDAATLTRKQEQKTSAKAYALYCAFRLYDNDECLSEAIGYNMYHRLRENDGEMKTLRDVLGNLSDEHRKSVLSDVVSNICFEGVYEAEGYIAALDLIKEKFAGVVEMCRDEGIRIEANEDGFIVGENVYSFWP